MFWIIFFMTYPISFVLFRIAFKEARAKFKTGEYSTEYEKKTFEEWRVAASIILFVPFLNILVSLCLCVIEAADKLKIF